MINTLEHATKIFESVKNGEVVEIVKSYMVLISSEDLTKEQKCWSDNDDEKETDFSTCPLWIWADYTWGISSPNDLLSFCEEHSLILPA